MQMCMLSPIRGRYLRLRFPIGKRTIQKELNQSKRPFLHKRGIGTFWASARKKTKCQQIKENNIGIVGFKQRIHRVVEIEIRHQR